MNSAEITSDSRGYQDGENAKSSTLLSPRGSILFEFFYWRSRKLLFGEASLPVCPSIIWRKLKIKIHGPGSGSLPALKIGSSNFFLQLQKPKRIFKSGFLALYLQHEL